MRLHDSYKYKLTKQRITYLVLNSILFLCIVAYSNVDAKHEEMRLINELNEIKVVNIEDSLIGTNEYTELLAYVPDLSAEEIQDTEDIENTENIETYTEGIELETDELNVLSTQDSPEYQLYDELVADLDKLKAKDKETVVKYFGISDVYTADAVADRVSTSRISLLGFDINESETVINIHICTIDYNRLNGDYNEYKQTLDDDSAKKSVTRNLVDGKYNVHYNIPMSIVDNEIVLSEGYKKAITGGWYFSNVELNTVECIY